MLKRLCIRRLDDLRQDVHWFAAEIHSWFAGEAGGRWLYSLVWKPSLENSELDKFDEAEVAKSRSRFEVPQVSPSWRQVRSRLNPVQHEPCSFVGKVCRPRLASQPMLVRQIRSVWAICLKSWEWKPGLVIGVPSHSESLFFDPDRLVATPHGCMLLHALQARRVSSLWITPAVPAKCMSFSWSGRDFGRFGSDDGLEVSGISVIRSLSLAAAAVTLAMRQKRPPWKYRFSDQRPAVQDIRRYQL